MADFYNVQPDVYKYLGKNFTSGRPWGIKGVTIHHMAGDMDADQCNNTWRNKRVSAHYSVDRSGLIAQHVDDMDRAWACGDGIGSGGGNDTTISIEHANNPRGPWTVHAAAIESGSHLTAALCRYYKLGRPQWMVNVFPHNHWASTACPGELAGSQNAEYMARAQYWYDQMQDGDDDMTPEQNKMLTECHHQLTRSDDPTGRGATQDFYVHLKFMAGAIQEINAKLTKLEKKLG